MALDLNVSPYYDDAADAISKNYNRILFKPGYAVQARELTQLQSILQDQVGKFGSHVFKNGTRVAGCGLQIDTKRDFIKVLDADVSGFTITDLSGYVGAKVIGLTSSIQAEIIYAISGSEDTSPDLNTLYLRYLSGDGESTAVHFYPGETIRVIESTQGDQVGDTFVVDDSFVEGNYYFGQGSFATMEDGIIFMDGKFVPFTKTTIELLKYNPAPTVRLGFIISDSIVTHETDETLLDPAQGTFNYAAPGADRYISEVLLVKYFYDETPPDDFVETASIVTGLLTKETTEDRIYADLGRNLAKRTYEESGNYTVKSFPILIREHLDTGSNNGLVPYNNENPNAGGDETLLAIGFEAGSAYVNGYNYETRQTEYIYVPKGNTTKVENELAISTAFGNYVLVDNFCGNWDIAAGDTVSLRSVAANAIGTSGSPTGGAQSGAAAAGSQIGTARVRYIALETGDPGVYNTQYRMYLYDIQMASTFNFENVKGIYYNTTAKGHANLVLEDNKAYIYESKFNSLLFKFPAKALKTSSPNGIDNSFQYTKQYDDTIDSNNSISITTGAGETFPFTVGTLTPTEILNNIIVSTKAAIADLDGSAYEIGSVLDLTATGVTVTNSGSQITIQFPGTISAATNVRVHCKVNVSNANHVSKVLYENAVVVIDTEASGDTTGTYTLGASDGYKLRSIKIGDFDEAAADIQASGTDVTSSFNFDTGQRDNFYDNARIVKKPGVSINLTDKKLVVTFDYFTHGGSPSTAYNFYTVDSYPVDDETTPAGTIRTEQIPVYTSTTSGITYDLRDTLDFRPRWDDTITFTTSPASANVNPARGSSPSGPTAGAIITPVPTEQFTTDIEYYLGRKDRLIMDKEGVFSSIYGVPSLSPVDPLEPQYGMSIAVIDIPPYPSLAPNVAKANGRPDYGVKYRTISNRRYTMRDIGTLEQRINRLEYYTSLTLLEKSASDMHIPSATDTTLSRFKNGILVDAFTGHNVGNVLSNEYHIAIDPQRKEMRPFFFMENVDLKYNNTTSTNIQKTGDLLTLPYTEAAMIVQPFASKFRNCVGELLFNYLGEVELDPPVDNWTDTTTLPDVAANFDGNYDAWETLADAWGTQWEDWQDVGTGRVIDVQTETLASNVQVRGDTLFQTDVQVSTTTTEQRQSRQGVQLSVTPGVESQRIGPRVTNTSIQPFMRSRTITFTATRLKPKTRVYPFFDGIAVSQHCSGASIDLPGAGFGSPLITDDNGTVVGRFRIPAGTFRTGEKLFRLSDDSKNREKFITTSCSRPFSANGLTQSVQDTVISTRVANLATNSVSDSRTTTEQNTTTARLEERAVGVVQNTTINNTFTTVNDITNVTEVTQVTNNINNVLVTEVTNNITNVTVIEESVETPQPPDCPARQGLPTGTVGQFAQGPRHQFGNNTWQCSPTGWQPDPIAQTFYVSDMPFGCFATSIDLAFRKKSLTNPITLQIREVVNGYPAERILPFGEVTLNPSQVNANEEADTAATTFAFPSPVFLQNNTEYCFVLLPAGNDPNYEIWVAELGENRVNTTTRISEQPNTGVLFTSANNRTWTSWQAEDIKFALYRAEFEVGTVGTVELDTYNDDYIKLDSFSDGTFNPGDRISSLSFVITNPGEDYDDGVIEHTVTNPTTSAGSATVNVTISGGVVTEIETINPGYGWNGIGSNTLTIVSGGGTGAVVNVSYNAGEIITADTLYNVYRVRNLQGYFSTDWPFVTSRESASANGGTAQIVEIEDKVLNALAANVAYLDHTPCHLIWSYSATGNTGAETAASTDFTNFIPDKTEELIFDAAVRSYSNEQDQLDGDKSFKVRAGMSTQTSTVSPVIDLKKCSMIVTRNDINDDPEDTGLGETTSVGTARSKYVSRQVTLDDGMEAEDLKVYLSQYMPVGTKVKVYGRFLAVGDPDAFEDKDWIELSATAPAGTFSGFAEYSYDIPDANLNGGIFEYVSNGVTYTGEIKTFAIKIVLLSNKTCVYPKCRELRAIALQV